MKLPAALSRFRMPNVRVPFDLDALLQKRWLRITVYVLFFLFCFLLFAYWSFPYDRVRDRIIREVEYTRGPGGALRPTGWELDIVDLSPSWGTGFTATGVQVGKRPEEPGKPTVSMLIDEATVHVSPFALIVGDLSVGFDLELAGGEIDGSYSQPIGAALGDEDGDLDLEATLEEVHLRRVSLLRSALGIPLSGVATGSFDFFVAQDPQQTEGRLDLTIRNLQVGNGRAKLAVGDNEGITIERIDAGDLKVKIEAEEGIGRITQLEAKGKDAELEGAGTLRLLSPLDMSRLDALFRIKFADAYRNENDRTRALFSLMEFSPKVRAARTPDGALQWRVAGSLGGQIVPSPAGKSKL